MIACPWPAGEREAVAADFREARPDAPPIAWVPLGPGDDPARVVDGVDAVLGLDARDLDGLRAAGRLESIGPDDPRAWRVTRRSVVGLAIDPARVGPVEGLQTRLGDRSLATLVGFDDPRRDRLTLHWMRSRLADDWSGGYAGLVRMAGRSGRVGRVGGSSLAAVGAGSLAVAPASGVPGAIDDRVSLVPGEPPTARLEGVAVVKGGANVDGARAFIAHLAGRGEAEPVPETERAPSPADLRADDLLADLLGATLVDAREELIDAVDTLDRAGRPRPFDAYLDQAPPWPPTSVDRLRQRPDSGPLLEALAREIAGDAGEAVRLVDSWGETPRPIDGEWLRAWGGGRIAAGPRFRAWLRGEWTAWARQHYRRIGREVGRLGAGSAGGGPP